MVNCGVMSHQCNSSPPPTDMVYISMANKQINLSQSRSLRSHVCRWIFLSVAISVGCLCYLTIYYQLIEAFDSAETFAVPLLLGGRHYQTSVRFDTSGEGGLYIHTYNHHYVLFIICHSLYLYFLLFQIEKKFGPEVSDYGNDINDNNNNNDKSEEEKFKTTINHYNNNNNIHFLSHDPLFNTFNDANVHVSKYLSDSVQLLVVKAKHRFELVKRKVKNVFNQYYYSARKRLHSHSSTPITDQKFCEKKEIYITKNFPISTDSADSTEHLFKTFLPDQTILSQCDVLVLGWKDLESGKQQQQQSVDNYFFALNSSETIFLNAKTNIALNNQNNIFVNYFELFQRILSKSSTSILGDLFHSVESYTGK